MKIQMNDNFNMKPEYAEEARRFSGYLVIFVNACCLCCCSGTGGGLFCE